ncbi:MAG: N-formylglutamate amidohydrolase [Acuticoccus sp.]
MDRTPPLFPFGILTAGDPAPVGHERRSLSRVVLVCEHAGNAVPQGLALGVDAADMARHIAIDIGALGVAREMSRALDAELIFQRYSRLVIDCNRPPSEPSAFPERADGTDVPGNVAMAPHDAAARTAEIFHPFTAAVSAALDRRVDAGIEPVLVAVHSFTPQHGDYPAPRPWPVAVLYDRDPRLSQALAAALRAEGLLVGENEPYQVGVLGDYTVPVHGEFRGIPHTLIEIRQDHIADTEGQRAFGLRLSQALTAALAAL